MTETLIEKWVLCGSSPRTAAISNPTKDKKKWSVRLTQYFTHYGNGLDARGEGATLREATVAAIIHFNQLIWKQVLRRTKDNAVHTNINDPIIKEMKAESKKEFSKFSFLNHEEVRKSIYRNEVLDL